MTGAPARPSRPPRLFAGYVLERPLGRGGMAEVFRARKKGPRNSQLFVALKRVLPQYADTPERVDRFLDEMEIAAQLKHPNIVGVLDFGESNGTYFLALELVEGLDVRSLAVKLAKQAAQKGARYPGQERGMLPAAIVAHIGMEAAKGLAYAHAQKLYGGGESGVIHRDISPDNLMIDIHGEVKVNDFGIAKSLKGEEDILSRTDHAYGKPLYAPPEQCTGKEVDVTADIYALGITLFRLITGRHPYDDPSRPDENPIAKIQRAFEKTRNPIAKLAPDMPPAMQEVLERIIQPDRLARPRSASEIIGPLKLSAKQAVEGHTIGGRPYDLHDIQEWAARLVRSVHEPGPRTAVEMDGIRPEELANSDRSSDRPAKSHKRLASSLAPRDARPPTPRSTGHDLLESSTDESGQTPPTAHMRQQTAPLAAPAVDAYSTSPRRRLLIAALAGSTLILLALLAGIAGFVFGGGRAARPPTEEAPPTAQVPTETTPSPATTAAPSPPLPALSPQTEATAGNTPVAQVADNAPETAAANTTTPPDDDESPEATEPESARRRPPRRRPTPPPEVRRVPPTHPSPGNQRARTQTPTLSDFGFGN